MVTRGKYTQIKTVRITKEQEEKLEELGANIRETVQYYIDMNTNEVRKLKQKEKYLLKTIPEKEKELKELENELKEVRVQLGRNPDENQASLEVIIAGDKILDNCKISNNGKTDTVTLANYMLTNKCKRILEAVIIEYNIKDKENFKKNVQKYLEL